ncbi:MAG: tetratricopeptide repeat protein [Nitrospinaceae bacterium]|nr:tetratricopeptide repeat protein [Nitrospinaceae bacterium]NIR57380.1 tetratricopeptide repeat protein [Nitrospinaceae bacterium]NIS87832.1 tetratricopeptide repeat protein [Nitrospinaceae bacterium]NIT84702.1 tetratricopeptide repeat protein [Nitrospinaceae bacterium]NIU46881.1 tetratricopeptide repeat protein [Nitrospinaceae bacterium]
MNTSIIPKKLIFLFATFGAGLLVTFLMAGPVGAGSDSLRKAQKLSQAGDWAGAVVEFRKALKTDPSNSLAQANLGVALSRIDKHREALLAFQKALEMGYDSANFRYFRGLSLARLGLLEDAAREIETALKMDSRMVRADYDLGIIYHQLGQDDKAREQVKILYKRNTKLAKKLFDQIPLDYTIISVDNGGTLKGKVNLTGKVPEPRAFHLIHAPNIEYCSRMSDGKGHRILYDFKTSESGGLENTVIAIQGVKKGKPFPRKMQSLHLHLCHADKYVIGIKNGENILVENTDPIKHEIATYEIYGSHRNQTSNISILPENSQVRSAFVKHDAPEFILKCNLHPFLQTRGYIISNPYFAVTDENGRFTIPDIPPGTYEVTAWHPFIPVLKGTVTIHAEQEAELKFTFKGENARRKLYHNDTKGYRFNTWYDSDVTFYGEPRVDDPVEVLQNFDNSKRYEGNLKPF